MAKKLYFDKEAAEKLKKGVDLAANAIGSTLGACGKYVIIAPGYGHMPVTTKDGVTVSKSIFVEDEVENVGVMMVRYASQKTVEDAGDGTTTSAVLAQSMINDGLDAIKNGANAQEVKAGIEKATALVIDELKKLSIPVADAETLKSVATISANNDEDIGGKLAAAYDQIGKSGILTIEKSHTIDTYVTVLEGSEMLRGYMNDKFVTNTGKLTVEYDNPLILVANYDVKTIKELIPFMEDFSKLYSFSAQPLVIIAKSFDGEPHNTMVVNKLKNGAKICLIEAPSAYQREALEDVATLTGATLITDDEGMKMEHALAAHLGTCKKIVVSKTNTIFIEGAGDKQEVELLKAKIQKEVDDTDNEQKKDIYQKRLARLSGSIGVIYVGGATDVEQKERHDRVDDANRAVKSALEEGIVPGGGIALIRSGQKINFSPFVGDQLVGANIVFDACFSPLKKMLLNAGIDPMLVVPVTMVESGNKGYNVRDKQFVDMMEAKILDPTKVVRCALQNASSVACQVINSGALLVEMKPE